MAFDKKTAALMGMNETAWERHANAWSVWTRFTVLPLLVISIWSRIWLGWWSLVPVALSIIWMLVNPHIFPKPRSTDNWASKGVLGERVYLNRDKIPIPEHHRRVPNIINMISSINMLFLVWGLIVLDFWCVVLGTILVQLGKMWFIDRMVLLYEEMKETNPEYRKWVY